MPPPPGGISSIAALIIPETVALVVYPPAETIGSTAALETKFPAETIADTAELVAYPLLATEVNAEVTAAVLAALADVAAMLDTVALVV